MPPAELQYRDVGLAYRRGDPVAECPDQRVGILTAKGHPDETFPDAKRPSLGLAQRPVR